MADPENQRNANEATPLLQEPHSEPLPDEATDEKRSARWYLWRMLWAVLAILLLALFVKGWVDAGEDVNVCDPDG